MKELIIIFLVFVISSCKKDGPALTGIEGKLVDQKGEVQKSIAISYVVQEYKKMGIIGGGYYPITNPTKTIIDSSGTFKISAILEENQNIALVYKLLLYNKIIDTFYVKPPHKLYDYEIQKGEYYKDVVIVVKK
jgi:hypothetical protein